MCVYVCVCVCVCVRVWRLYSRYKKSPSFVTAHIVVDASVISESTYCHNIVLEDWARLEDPRGTLFVSIPTVLDPSVAPEGKHIVHAFTPDWIENWQNLSSEEYVPLFLPPFPSSYSLATLRLPSR